ncbi:hypothetical protein GYB61_05400 [bacterium]|nr:hypothetical protein [bacterium]
MSASDTVVLQSCPDGEAGGWMGQCMASVRGWAQSRGYQYRHCGDELFDYLDAELRAKTEAQPVVASDLARLRWMQAVLDAGAEAVIWLDADVFVAAPAALQPPDADFAPGREVWVQGSGKHLRSYRKVHNAALLARRSAPALPYYADAAERILRAHRPGHMVPQLLGPKLLTALHNIAPFEVWNDVGMLSPAVAHDLLSGGGPALDQFEADSGAWPAALNLCRSSVTDRLLTDRNMHDVIEQICQRFVNHSR